MITHTGLQQFPIPGSQRLHFNDCWDRNSLVLVALDAVQVLELAASSDSYTATNKAGLANRPRSKRLDTFLVSGVPNAPRRSGAEQELIAVDKKRFEKQGSFSV